MCIVRPIGFSVRKHIWQNRRSVAQTSDRHFRNKCGSDYIFPVQSRSCREQQIPSSFVSNFFNFIYLLSTFKNSEQQPLVELRNFSKLDNKSFPSDFFFNDIQAAKVPLCDCSLLFKCFCYYIEIAFRTDYNHWCGYETPGHVVKHGRTWIHIESSML